ncbi:hypothetical protein CMQ_5235 [Grosmannia clavigera kw1407]|uniref:Uncharacterized protein n=1 Tax=Grosmannia clavigera (strain kw1407 / UAMH 11150) TaxID=655863 RepID=F0XB36_GROCL|nr:uncharacterized protein CMQ_5235 [Grosmannia clavigera kw1407]EFX04973.1 hypothetical protein CMQ_5235 [Grosmannia clavigera kw1407]
MPSIEIHFDQAGQNEYEPPNANPLPGPITEAALGNTSLWTASGELAILLVNPTRLSTTSPTFKYQSFYKELMSELNVVATGPENNESAIEEIVAKILSQAKTEFYEKCPSSLHFFNAWAFRVSKDIEATETGADVFHRLLSCTNPFPEPGENLDRLLEISEAFGCAYTTVMMAFGLYPGYRPKAEMLKIMDRLDDVVAAVQPLSPGYMAEKHLLERMVHFAITVRTMRIASGGNGTGIPRVAFPSPSEVAMAVHWCLDQLPDDIQQPMQEVGQNLSTATSQPHIQLLAVTASALQEAVTSRKEQQPQILPQFTQVSESFAQCDEVLDLVGKSNRIYEKFVSIYKNTHGNHNMNHMNILYMLLKQHEDLVYKLLKHGEGSQARISTAPKLDSENQDGKLEADSFYQMHHQVLKHAYNMRQEGAFFSYDAYLAAYHAAEYAGQQQKKLEAVFQRFAEGQKLAVMQFRENQKPHTPNEAHKMQNATQASLILDEEQSNSNWLTSDELDHLLDHQEWLRSYMGLELRVERLLRDDVAMPDMV